MAVYVFRINYGDDFSYLKKEVGNGRLRQGWGVSGMSLCNDYNEFQQAWMKAWGGNDDDLPRIKRKYNNLCTMKNIKKGDYIIIPKLDMNLEYPCDSFTITRCISEYSFEPAPEFDDYGHIIGVEVLFSCFYKHPWEAINISSKFRAYQSAVNNVYSDSVTESLEKLIERNNQEPLTSSTTPKSLINTLSQGINEQYQMLVNHVLSMLRKMSPQDFEGIITELFHKNGYILKRKNDYDGKGGDIDITLSVDDNSLLGSVFGQATTVGDFEINIQAKKKTGKDKDDIKAVNQLITRKRTKNSDCVDINIVIDLTDEFQTATEELAKNNSIILINGYQFASLLIQFGLAGDIGE